MAREEVLSYIRQVRSQGFHDADIHLNLEHAGYPSQAIIEAFEAADAEQTASEISRLSRFSSVPTLPSPPQELSPVLNSRNISQNELSLTQNFPSQESDDSSTLAPNSIMPTATPIVIPHGVFGRLGMVLRHPGRFFSGLPETDHTATHALSEYYLVTGFISLFWFGIIVGFRVLFPDLAAGLGDDIIVASLLAFVLWCFLAPALTLLWHPFVAALGGQESMGRSTQVIIYSLLAPLMLSILPVANIVALVLMPSTIYQGVRRVHQGSAVASIAVMFLLLGLFAALLFGCWFAAQSLPLNQQMS